LPVPVNVLDDCATHQKSYRDAGFVGEAAELGELLIADVKRSPREWSPWSHGVPPC
jgi:hypothetical protein